MNEDHITVAQAAIILGVTVQAMSYLMKTGRIKPVGRLGQQYVLSKAAIENFKLQRERLRP